MIDTARVLASIQREFPAPRIDPAWIQACADALSDAGQDPSLHNIRDQYLFSDLSTSTLPTSLIPDDPHDVHLFPTPTLVQLISITEIGHSAFQLQTIQSQRKDVISGVTRIRRMGDDDADDGDDEERDNGKIPAYPRGMLKMEITDGRRIIKALEYRRLDSLKLAETPLGSKFLLHKVRALRSTLLLDHSNTTFLGFEVTHLEVEQPLQFTNSLLLRMGRPPLDVDEGAPPPRDDPPAGPARSQRATPAARPAPPAAPAAASRRLTIPQSNTSTAGPSRSRAPGQPSNTVQSPFFSQNATASSSRGPTASAAAARRAAAIQAIEVEEDDYDVEYDDSFIRQLDAVEAKVTSVRPNIGKYQEVSSDYGGDEIDDALLGELEMVERGHITARNGVGRGTGTIKSRSRWEDDFVVNLHDEEDYEDEVRGSRRVGKSAGVSKVAVPKKRKVKAETGTGTRGKGNWNDVIEISD